MKTYEKTDAPLSKISEKQQTINETSMKTCRNTDENPKKLCRTLIKHNENSTQTQWNTSDTITNNDDNREKLVAKLLKTI